MKDKAAKKAYDARRYQGRRVQADAANRFYRKANREQVLRYTRDWHLRKKYGITIEDFERMLAKQDGLCAICGQVPKDTMDVDHDHATGKVRALLCHGCNVGLGAFGESQATMSAAIEYLRGHACAYI